ncbi:KTSC domain-containing protein [Kineococcus sp. SYSU DK003]|uniref:KTSC domain-containing protein n=1 Tax=Kineococcus sp. SYSU DK003 TaxID=3383124 RepID=UPI003D7CB05A
MSNIQWTHVHSSRITAEAYDAVKQRIYVRFPDGVEYWYGNCTPEVWADFTAPGQSRGKYIAAHLDERPRGHLNRR